MDLASHAGGTFTGALIPMKVITFILSSPLMLIGAVAKFAWEGMRSGWVTMGVVLGFINDDP